MKIQLLFSNFFHSNNATTNTWLCNHHYWIKWVKRGLYYCDVSCFNPLMHVFNTTFVHCKHNSMPMYVRTGKTKIFPFRTSLDFLRDCFKKHVHEFFMPLYYKTSCISPSVRLSVRHNSSVIRTKNRSENVNKIY